LEQLEADEQARLVIGADAAPLAAGVDAEEHVTTRSDLHRAQRPHRVEVRRDTRQNRAIAFADVDVAEGIDRDPAAPRRAALEDVIDDELHHPRFPTRRRGNGEQTFEEIHAHRNTKNEPRNRYARAHPLARRRSSRRRSPSSVTARANRDRSLAMSLDA